AGRGDDLAGSGWDSGTPGTAGMVAGPGPASADPSGTAGPTGACYYTAAGSLGGDVVSLKGRSLLTKRPWPTRADTEDTQKSDTRADGRERNTTVNVKTGAIAWPVRPAGASFTG